LSEILIEFAVRTAAALVFAGEFLFLGYPILRKYVRNEGFFSQLLYSHLLSASIMITVLWTAYTGFRSIVPLEATSALLVTLAIGGTAMFLCDFARQRRVLSREGWGYVLLISFAVLLAVVSAATLPFNAQGDAYGYYVPLGRYLNQNPGAYVDSFHRFSFSRNFAYYAIYAHADLLGGSLQSYLFLPIPFVLGTMVAVTSVTKRLTTRGSVPLIATAIYVFSVYFGLLLKYDMFYLGNLLMATIALYYCYFLLTGAKRLLEKVALPLSSFSVLLLYDFALLLIVPLALGYLAHRKPRLAVYVAAGLALPLWLAFSLQGVTLGLVQIQKLDLESSIAFLGLILVVLAGLGKGTIRSADDSPSFYPTLFASLAAGASLLVQRIANLLNFGFLAVQNLNLSGPVLAYMQRNYWFYATPPNIPDTLLSIFFSDAFFGWGLLFTAYGLFLGRGRPATTFFLTVLPLSVLVETINNNYIRFGLFLAPLIVVFLAIGLHSLTGRKALLVGLSLSSVILISRAVTTLPNLDYEHRALASPLDGALFGVTLLFAIISHLQRKHLRYRLSPSMLAAKFRRLRSRFRVKSRIDLSQLAAVLLVALSISVLSYNVLNPKYSSQINNHDAILLDQQVLPLIQEKSTVVTVELVHPNFEFYKDIVVIPMAQPWILDSFLSLHLSDVPALMSWLGSSGIRYVFVDRDLTSANKDVFGVFDKLSASCSAYGRQCTPLFDDGRFLLLGINING
jgi:hypothetical protein